MKLRLVSRAAIATVLVGVALRLAAAQNSPQAPLHGDASANGDVLYRQACAMCHDAPGDTRAPAASGLRRMLPENVVRALESGLMKDQGSALTAAEKRAVAEFVTARTLGTNVGRTKTALCADPRAAFAPAGPSWNGWSPDLANTRFQPAENAGLAATDVSRLDLKWAFAFPNTFVANGQPTIVGGRIFVPSANRNVYSLDAKSGCQYWSFESETPVRAAISVAALRGAAGRHVAFFGDARATVYAVDATTGELVWKTRVDDHPRSKIVGAPAYYGGRLFVPVTAAEEGFAPNGKYECCTARGSLVVLDAATGKQIWKTFTIEEQPRVTGKNADGTPVWGPSGASIWSAPTIDVARQIVYVGTGDNFSHPSTKNSDAILAFDMKSGTVRWSRQITKADVWNNACISVSRANCPDSAGPDFDIASSAILARLPSGKQLLLVSQKSGVVHALDPDKRGEIVWQRRVGRGGVVGGIQFGSAFDGRNMYVAVSDMGFVSETIDLGARLVIDPKIGGGFYALDAATGHSVWRAAPPPCDERRPRCSPAQSAAVSAIPGAVFSGSVDGHLRAYSAANGAVLWDFDTAREFTAVNGFAANGGSMNGPGPTVADGMVYVVSGYGSGMPGNVLLAFSVDGK